MKFRSLQHIENYLLKADEQRQDHYTLDRVQQAVEILGNPQLTYKVVHVGGTSGKGSTCQIVSSILQASGKRVGLFTSPAIVSPLERLQMNGKPVTEKKFVELTNRIWSQLKTIQLTYFEFFTIMALYYFAEAKADYAVIEVGMGGRLDATNVVTPTVAIVTTIGLDHTKQLGRTRPLIAREKEHIIKPGCIGLTGSQYVHRGIYIDTTKAHIDSQDLSGTVFTYRSLKRLRLNMLGQFQIHNAVLAIEATRRLKISEAVIRKGLQQASNSGRFEIITRHPLVIMDGAHNPEKMTSFVGSLQKIIDIKSYDQVVGLIALKYNKDATATLRPLVRKLNKVVITTFDQGMSVTQLRNIVRKINPTVKVVLQANSTKAFREFTGQVQPHDLGIITGSLYMIGNLRAAKLV